ncbi:TATA element modulatory factor-like isoform X25 [Aphis gossypii]|uniref:TATA element modulatory factor-like isoform X23 n=1 Tax=Aphis gossypii TaxID=80765 RepID=UPI002158CD51|nr:TATA element modulatory factor-like isoform X23 [Aphis gossypii]XP_050063655.1 TATA element modulatory factor-like isoform X25 [Aphis gossypii]
MNHSSSNNEDLREEFKNLIIKIEPYYVALKSDLEKLLCREWLHKLFKTATHEESLRNAYLVKLLSQLEKGKLIEPFDNLPKHNSPLLPLITNNLPKQNVNVCNKKKILTKKEPLITDVVTVHNTDGSLKSTKNHKHTNEIKVNEHLNQEKQLDINEISDDSKEVNPPVNESSNQEKRLDVKEISDDSKEVNLPVNESLNQEKRLDVNEISDDSKEVNLPVNESSNQGKRLNVNEISDNSKEVQQQKITVDKSEGGDGLTLNEETKLKLESVEKMSNELKKKTELLTKEFQEIELYANKNLTNNDQLTVLSADLSKCKNDIENMYNLEVADELCASNLLKNILDKTTALDNTIVSEIHRLKTMVEDSCASKKSMNFVMDQLKEKHRLKISEKDKFHTEINRKLMIEISRLKECVGKVEEEAMCEEFSNENYEDEYSST